MARSGSTRGMIALPQRRRAFALQPATRTSAAPGISRTADFKVPKSRATWQHDALTYYETLPPIGFVMDFKASVVAACDFNVMVDTKDGRQRVEKDEKIERLMASLVGPRGGMEELVRRAALLLEITGEALFVGTPVEDEAEAVWWEFLSIEEILPPDQSAGAGGRFRRDYGNGEKVELPPDAYIARMWRSDARFSNRASCGLRRCLDTCRELVLLSRMTEAIIASRLPMGLLLVPDTIEWNSTLTRTDETAGSDLDVAEESDFLDDLIQHLSAPITDFGNAATMVPLVIRANKDDLDAIKVVDLARSLDQYAAGLRDEMYGRLAIGLDVPAETLEGKGGMNHWCVDETTQILTLERGWIAHQDLQCGDVVLTLNHDTGLSEWQPVGTVERFDVKDLDMLSIEGLTHSSLTTLNHRWPTMHRRFNRVFVDGRHRTEKGGVERYWTSSEKLNTCDSLVTAAPNADLPTEAKWSDAFVELVAWFWTEGSCEARAGRNAPTVSIHQSHMVNDANVARIRRALTTLYGPATDGPMGAGGFGRRRKDGYGPQGETPMWREVVQPRSGRGMTEFKLNLAAGAPLAAVAPNRLVDKQFIHELTAAQLDLFIDVSVRADGTTNPAGTRYLGQKAQERIEPLELALVLSGRSTYTYDVWSKPDGADGRDRLMHWVSFSDRTGYGIHRKTMDVVPYTGVVWCPTTPNRTWFAKRNGKTFFTGNTSWNIDNEMLFKHAAPVGRLIADFWTYAYLRPFLILSEGLSVQDAADYLIEFDPTPLANNEDDDSKARTLWEQLLISDRAVVEKQGWEPDAVMPDEAERTRRLVEKMVLAKVVSLSDEGAAFLGLDPSWFAVADPRRTPPAEFGQPPLETIPGVGLVPAEGNAAPEVVPQQKGPPEQPPADKANGDAGTSPPARSQARGGVTELLLARQLATAADAAYFRALEVAGGRILTACQKVPAFRGRFHATRRADVPSSLSSTDLGALKVNAPMLLDGAWDEFAAQTSEWLRDYLVRQGASGSAAEADATRLTAGLVAEVAKWGVANFHGARVRDRSTGLRVPAGMFVATVEEAHSRRALAAVS